MTEQTNSGEKESNVEEKWNSIKEFHDDYMKKLSLVTCIPSDVEIALSMTKEQRERLDPEECSSLAVCLSQAAIHIQKEINLHQMCINWCDRNIDTVFAPQMNNYGDQYTSKDIKRLSFIKDNSMAFALFKLRSSAQIRLDSLDKMPQQMGFIASALKDMSQVKRRGVQ